MEAEEPALRLDQLPPDALRLVAAGCIGSYEPDEYGDVLRRAEAGRLRGSCKALLSAAEAAVASGLVKVCLWPKAWPPPSMGVLTRCARHLDLCDCWEQVTNEALRELAEAAPELEGLTLAYSGRVTDVSALASMRSLNFLNLSSTGVADVSPLSACTALTELLLYGTKVTDVSALASIPSLHIYR